MGQKQSYDVTQGDNKRGDVPYMVDPNEKGEPTPTHLKVTEVTVTQERVEAHKTDGEGYYKLERIPPHEDLPIREYVDIMLDETTVETE